MEAIELSSRKALLDHVSIRSRDADVCWKTPTGDASRTEPLPAGAALGVPRAAVQNGAPGRDGRNAGRTLGIVCRRGTDRKYVFGGRTARSPAPGDKRFPKIGRAHV